MGMIQDKLLQKRTLFELGFPVGFFSEINDSNDDKHIFPLIWKARLEDTMEEVLSRYLMRSS